MENSLITLDIPPFLISHQQYLTPSLNIDDRKRIKMKWEKIKGLDNCINPVEQVFCELHFPFDISKSRAYTYLAGKKGLTKRFVIDEVRRSYGHLFRHTSEVAAIWEGGLRNSVLHHVSYPFSSLFVTRALFHPDTLRLEIDVEGRPVPLNSIDIPF